MRESAPSAASRGDEVEVDLPAPRVAVAAQVLQQERLDARVGLVEPGLGVGAARQLVERQRLHLADVALEPLERAVALGRDVDDDEAVDEVGVPQREDHRRPCRRASGRRPSTSPPAPPPQRRGDGVGIRLEGELLRPRRAAVVGQVDEQAARPRAVGAATALAIWFQLRPCPKSPCRKAMRGPAVPTDSVLSGAWSGAEVMPREPTRRPPHGRPSRAVRLPRVGGCVTSPPRREAREGDVTARVTAGRSTCNTAFLA